MITCTICRCSINERTEARWTVGYDTLCSPKCIIAWRKATGSW